MPGRNSQKKSRQKAKRQRVTRGGEPKSLSERVAGAEGVPPSARSPELVEGRGLTSRGRAPDRTRETKQLPNQQISHQNCQSAKNGIRKSDCKLIQPKNRNKWNSNIRI